jgi:FkbM family methyltransferase
MYRFFRNLRMHARLLIDVKRLRVHGVLIDTRAEMMPRSIRTALFKNTYEMHERRLVDEIIEPTDRVLEIGAGIGLVSLLCAKICGPQNVLSYEANRSVESVIRNNYALNGWNPNLCMKAITTDGADVTFYVDSNVISSSLLDRNTGGPVFVPSDSLAEVISDFSPSAIVMDVEGAEIELLMETSLEGISKLIVELHPHLVGEEAAIALREHLRQQGFDEVRYLHKTACYVRSQSGCRESSQVQSSRAA